MLASELGVRAASEAFRDKPRLGGSNLDCAVNKVFKLGVEAKDEGPRSRDKDGLERKALVDVAVVVVVVVEAIARADDQIGSRLAAHPQRSGSLGLLGALGQVQEGTCACRVGSATTSSRCPLLPALDSRCLDVCLPKNPTLGFCTTGQLLEPR